jgi:hypothetical protein
MTHCDDCTPSVIQAEVNAVILDNAVLLKAHARSFAEAARQLRELAHEMDGDKRQVLLAVAKTLSRTAQLIKEPIARIRKCGDGTTARRIDWDRRIQQARDDGDIPL